MSSTHIIARSYSTQTGGPVANTVFNYTGDIEKTLDTSVPPSTTAEPVNIQWTAAKVQCLMLWASGACTVLTNSATTPTTTINLTANQLVSWGTADPPPSPIPGDVTTLFATNSSATAAVALKIRVLLSV